MGNAARKARKKAVRNGDESQQFEHEPKRPTRPYPTKEIREEERKLRSEYNRAQRNPFATMQQYERELAAAEAELR